MANTATQESFVSTLNTGGALDKGSGFDRKFGAKETNQQYSDRLDAWKNKGKPGGAAATKPPIPTRSPGAPGMAGGNMPNSGLVDRRPPGIGGLGNPIGAGATGGGLGTPTPTSATAAVEGLQGAGGAAAMSQPGVAMSGGGGPVELPGAGSLRQGLGQRMYPEMNSALAGLKRIY